ncbi:KxYKxGKxW signal peptide domain-containing protein, partial [Staphylococcus xylosus]|uniref:KxYKxGKxW signal peptide domain-containing protein n=1 Tax=Staphylococcus xylosus TaxID=1288 RepID=UPI003F569D89
MTKREREFKRSFNEEKSRVKLYKSGKNWVKAGIKEIKLLGVLGLSIFDKSSEKTQEETKRTFGDSVKKNSLKTTGILGGAFVANMLHNQHALAASELPVTSELSSQSETVGNQTSTVVNQSETSESSTPTSDKASSEDSTSTSDKASSESSTSTSDKASSESSTSTSDKASSEDSTSTSDKASSEDSTSTSDKASSESSTSTSDKA